MSNGKPWAANLSCSQLLGSLVIVAHVASNAGCIAQIMEAAGVNTHNWSLEKAPLVPHPATSPQVGPSEIVLPINGGQSYTLTSGPGGSLCVHIKIPDYAGKPDFTDPDPWRFYIGSDKHWPTVKYQSVTSSSVTIAAHKCTDMGSESFMAGDRLVTQRKFRCRTEMDACFDGMSKAMNGNELYITLSSGNKHPSSGEMEYTPEESKVTWRFR